MVRASKLLDEMQQNPAGWRFEEVERVLRENGFEFVNQRGSDRIYKHAGGVRVFLSWHGSGEVKRGYVRRVVRAIKEARRTT